ncbi:acyl-CoA N-acyltransferase [Microdochium trichocladiopsis]|uniref:Acyl-CoA N-acyltransferase n=1 Tax=Microdochium trichocladiopsis TaxID=1682393 RepID=A0A9P8YHM8_9PEZI|nr:acyl-CoA N-acyltransferase [Microdochium trichocladiopsis]KAH7040564.1 acyl-CoA N-acyltransferase [Microdochium trichocladiopsis]
MAPSVVYLPDGQYFTVQPVFSGLFFKLNDAQQSSHPAPYPAGWTVVLHSEDNVENHVDGLTIQDDDDEARSRRSHSHRYSKPTLQNDTLFISSISNPSSTDPPASASRQIALMLWITLYWYFHQTEPSPYTETKSSRATPLEAKPRGDWRIRIKRDGVLRTRNMIPKLERMGLITSMDTSVGTGPEAGTQGWDTMYVTRSVFWQIPSGLFLFNLQTHRQNSIPGSPLPTSRPTSPVRNEVAQQNINSASHAHTHHLSVDSIQLPQPITSTPTFPIGPYFSPSRLPTYYPPPPLRYTVTGGVRHPIRPKPPQMGEVFYARYIPSTGKYLSIRVASSSPRPVNYFGPVADAEREHAHLMNLSDTSLMQMWLSNPRVSKFWGEFHAEFLTNALKSQHSFPAIAMWDGVPFAYFEIYWVKEDILGQALGHEVGDFDRGFHVLVGEEWARGKVSLWMSSLVHWAWQNDYRTSNVWLEPRVDNHKFLQRLLENGFAKIRTVAFPHKQASACRLSREAWDGPAI